MSKALLIRSYEEKKGGEQGKWNKLDQTPSYIQGIETGKILDDMSADKLGALISGVPTPWARAKLFRFALQTLSTPDPNINQAGLLQFYKLLHGEWQGLLAVMALYPDRIRISKPVYMDVRGGDYSIAAAFGRMLFEESDLWCNQDELLKSPDAQPYIQLIYYKGHLVGGTSPLTGVFTGVSCNLEKDAQDINWYRKGKFEDPTNYLSPLQLQKVYLFVKNLNAHLAAFDAKVNSQRAGKPAVSINGFMQMSRNWENELLQKGNGKLHQIGPVANYGKILKCPFNILFHSEIPVYLKPDYTFTYSDPTGTYKKISDIQSLLADDDFVVGWTEQANTRNSLKNAPVFFLMVNDITGNSNKFFSLPLSERAIEIFHNGLSSILGYKPKQGVSLKAEIAPEGDVLTVNMVIVIDGEEVALGAREYKIKWQTSMQKVILWPNFISDKWNRYYIYNQKSDASQPDYMPIYQTMGKIIKNQDGVFYTEDYNPEDGSQMPVAIKELVATPADAGDSLPKYSITVADKPITGLSVKVKQGGNDAHAGFLIIRQDVVEDLTGKTMVATANVGFDFGSNNTCVYYQDSQNSGVSPIEFHDYRTMLVGQEIQNPNRVAEIDELLFFTNYDSNDGQFKSWLHEHDSRCNKFTLQEEIAGGVPVNRPNVQVNKMTKREITTQAGILHFNMKWLDDAVGLQKKRAFIKSLWLQTCAFLYQKQITPNKINWSYPGAMMNSDINELSKIFGSLPSVTPTTGVQTTVARPITEAEAVCHYAMSQPNFGLTSTNMFLGIDVGGSTSDILMLAKDPTNNGEPALLKESSVRLAAGVFFDAVTGSQRFREALVTFHGGHKTGVNVMNIEELMNSVNKDKAPYYLNCIFDQLKANEYNTFYESLDANAKFVFTIPAYVTGVLLFYSGMLIGKTLKDYNIEDKIETIEVLPFGKGGRLFHWLYSAAGQMATEDYYSDCVNRGVKCILDDNKLEVILRTQLAVNNKTEVARGLCSTQKLNMANNVGESDICAESGVQYRGSDGLLIDLPVDKELDGSYFNDISKFEFGRGANFDQFMNVFTEFVCRTTKLYEDDEESLRKDIRDIPGRIINFIKTDDEYIKAKKATSQNFPYHQPIFMVEAASYLRTLVDKIFAY